jgi:hypothetical protein
MPATSISVTASATPPPCARRWTRPEPYEWLSKPKEGHGFYSEKDRLDLYRHMQNFLGKYLGG